MILLDDDERYELRMSLPTHHTTYEYETTFNKAQIEKILIQLQAIYNIPDLKAEDVRMGEFIQELMEEVGE